MRRAGAADVQPPAFNNDEDAARYYLNQLLARDARSTLRGLAEEDPGRLPSLRKDSVQSVPQKGTRLVKFAQVRNAVPVLGANAVVELNERREHVSTNADLVSVGDVSSIAALTATDAVQKIAALTNEPLDLAALEKPSLGFYYAPDQRWHLVYCFTSVPAAPKAFLEEARDHISQGHGPGSSPREEYPELDYLVDAHDGSILNYYSSTPMVMPAYCEGIDENGANRGFYAVRVEGSTDYELQDPIRSIWTYNLKGDLLTQATTVPMIPIRNDHFRWEKHRAAVSAHANASRIYHFLTSVLYRNGIDDKRMPLRSIINCVRNDPKDPPPQWHNAVWWKDAMWYGQNFDGDPAAAPLRSYSRYLDIIAHEVMHGVTKRTAGLIYQGETGALNESFSDIFGVIIANWADVGAPEPVDFDGWTWEIGTGWGKGGLPLRDLSNPKRTKDPDHTKDFLKTTKDNGGVHTNSNIHNKAAHNLLTSKTAEGTFLFTPRDAATVYYLTLCRLSNMATFIDARNTLITVTESYYSDPAQREVRVAAVCDAYDRVGIAEA
jgi:Zn-dependent metalloprotease